MTETILAQWDGDVLARKPIGDFLYRLLVRKLEASDGDANAGAICFALDGAWGSGKTFFVRHWVTDIENCEHPVVLFDAWKNDLSKEPLMGFIATIQAGLKQWTSKVPRGNQLKSEAAQVSRDAFRKAGRAVVPVSALLIKGALKKLSGTGFDELLDAFREAGDDELDTNTGAEQKAQEPGKLVDDVIDEFFKASLDEHTRHIKAIDEFKRAIGELLAYLESKVKARLPLFIVIDELDRCRPDYAIELLEGIKHLFDVRGICFCVSTNLTQLSESIKGVYGSGFDSRRYLKRFFSFEYVLPPPSDHAFAELLVPNSIMSRHPKIASGLCDWQATQGPESIAKSFHFVARSFRLDLRSQRQVFEIADAACAGVDEKRLIHTLYLFSLASLWHVDRDLFMGLQAGISRDELNRRLSPLIATDASHHYTVLVPSDSAFRGERKAAQVRFTELFNIYMQLAEKDLKDIREAFYRSRSDQYPKSLERSIADEMPSSYSPGKEYPPSIRPYADLIRTAGQMTVAVE